MSKYFTNTPCKKCLFAIYDNMTQTGCIFDRLNIFKKYNIKILEVFDEEKEFYLIKDRLCMWFRNYQWVHNTKDNEYQKQQIKKEIEIQYQAIVFTNNQLEDITNTIDSLLQQVIKPKHITIIKPTNITIKPSYLTDLLIKTGIPWRVENIVNPELNHGNMIDLVLDIIKHQYYAVFNAGCIIPKDTFKVLNYKINDELYPLTVLKPNNNNDGLIVSLILHKIYQGNVTDSLINKLEKDKIPLTQITEICPNFPK